MIGEIIAIGDELTSGRIANTTSSFAARQLFGAGHEIAAMHTIGDSPRLIGEALKRAIKRADFILVTGGLGSTSDDKTTQAVAQALGLPVVLNEELYQRIVSQQDGTGPARNLEKLAWVPAGAQVFDTRARMCGYLLVHDNTPIFFLPGVPSQMQELLVNHVLPRLASWPGSTNHHKLRLYRTFGLPEIEINHLLAPLEQEGSVKIGYYPVGCEVHVSLTVTGENEEQTESIFAEYDHRVAALLGDALYGTDGDSLAAVLGQLLVARQRFLSVAESCTGGLIGSKITEVAGSSHWFAGGVISYANTVKEDLLDVQPSLLVTHGAVSDQVARAMAQGVSIRTGTDFAISATGIAGPGGGTPEKPVGTVYIGLRNRDALSARRYRFDGSRRQIREVTACTALDRARRSLLRLPELEEIRCHI